MNRLPRLLQPSLIVILVISVFALAFVAYTQHQSQQYWKSEYGNATHLQQYWQGKYANATGQLPLSLSMLWFANYTVDKAKFLDSSGQEIYPVKTEFWDGGDAVTFWFSEYDVCDRTVLLQLPSYGNYTHVDLPFFDIRLALPPKK